LSFFDEDDEPRRTVPRPRRARPAGGAVAADSQTLLIRRAVALVGGLLILVLLVIAVNSCRTSQKENALKDYNRRLSAIALESSRQVGQPFFDLLTQGGGGSPQDLQTAISGFRVQAEQQYRQTEELDVPGEMRGAQQSALIALEWRRDGLDRIAQQIRTALGDEGEAADAAIEDIAGQMEVFLASDVAWYTRVGPLVEGALEDAEIGGQEIVRSQFLPDLAWLQPETIAAELEQQLTGGGGGDGEPTGPGLHGTGIDSTVYGDVTLQPGVSNRLTFTPDQPFVVTFTNQGENDEFDIRVTLRVQSEGGGPEITASDTIPRLVPGESAEAALLLEEAPPLDTATTVRVQVARVPGEEKVDNNRSEYPVLFGQE
jgi:hypothetical protein